MDQHGRPISPGDFSNMEDNTMDWFDRSPSPSDSTVSRDSSISLEELEPRPLSVADGAETGNDDIFKQTRINYPDIAGQLPVVSEKEWTRLHLGINYSVTVQKYSSYTVAFLAVVHFANVSIVPVLVTWSVPGAKTYLAQACKVYKMPAAMTALVGVPIVVHITAGVTARLLRGRWNRIHHSLMSHLQTDLQFNPARFTWISTGGYTFSALLATNMAVNWFLSPAGQDNGFNIRLGFAADRFIKNPVVTWATYAVVMGAGAMHVIWGMASWLGWSPTVTSFWGRRALNVPRQLRRERRRKWYAVNGVGLLLASSCAAAGFGTVGGGRVTAGLADVMVRGLQADV